MDDNRCRITVVGMRRRVNLAVPARAPIGEYLPDLIHRCGQVGDDTLPPAWSLARAGEPPLPPSMSLLEAQVVDGATLYLRDLVAGETDGPLVTDLEDAVVDEGGRWERWSGWHRALTAVVLATLGFLAAVATFVVTTPDSPLAGLVAAAYGSALVLVAGLATRKDWPVPAPLRVGLALVAVPALALAGYALPVSRVSENAAVVAAAGGAAIGALAVLLAVIDVWTLTVALLAVVSVPVAVLLALVRADATERVAVVTVVALVLLALGPGLAGRLASLPPGQGAAAPVTDASAEAAAVLDRSRRVLVAWSVTAAVVLVSGLVVLSRSTNLYAVFLVLCVGLALIAQAGQSTVPAAVVPVLTAGVAGLVALGLQAPATFLPWLPGPLQMLVVCGLCLTAMVVGLVKLVEPADDGGARPAWIGSVASTLSVLSIALAVGVFGVFEALAQVGGQL
ncbi:type VII secretion integral membrane protein EccD [Promicromonospora thailandica]|uniref:Type VII secretion integral membrane protein EccD n=1 Tax=Promicromonospora thailandica TaxID=765201 RepID=A0A9X2G062_9MICO|nr:type VII secretion integral membrane protein EccD [Promicromonospora thailandica]MCP2263273.1 type VII secretion integral membrane protein EccD [Promicromonospora thailandica]